MHVFVLCCAGVAVYSWALNCVMVPDSTQIYVGLLGDVTSTLSSCQLFRGCVLPNDPYA